MAKTLKEIIEDLKEQGHAVTFRQRTGKSGGGFIITSIDGVKYKNKEGNAQARELVGATLSPARAAANNANAAKRKAKAAKNNISEELEKKLHRAQRKWRKMRNRQKREGKKEASKLTKKRVADLVRHHGTSEAERALDQAERYAKGLAYDKAIDYIENRIIKKAEAKGEDFSAVIKYIDDKRNDLTSNIYDNVLYLVYKYEQEQIQNIEELLRQIKNEFDWGEINPFNTKTTSNNRKSKAKAKADEENIFDVIDPFK